MALVNHSAREITCKLVYYGPARSGKTSNLLYVHAHLPAERKGEMLSLATEADRTLFFDFLPVDLGEISGFRTRLQLYTVPGQVYYDETRKLVLRGADGVVFVADSQREKAAEDLESLRNLHENLLEHGLELKALPFVVQYNKRDLPGVLPAHDLSELLNFMDVPEFEAVALTGQGVFDTLRAASEQVLRSVSRRFDQPFLPGKGGDAS